MDEHRIGLKPILRRVWAPKGQRPIALGHHRYKWLYLTAFVPPTSGEVFWYVSNGVSKPFFAALLARAAGADVMPRCTNSRANTGLILSASPRPATVAGSGSGAKIQRLRGITGINNKDRNSLKSTQKIAGVPSPGLLPSP